MEKDYVMTPHEVSSKYSPLALAYIGDSVYDLMVKTYFVKQSNMQPEKYHKKVTSIVSAAAQAEFVTGIMDELTEEELAVFKRARNSSPHTKAKNASLTDYLTATGFEAVIGYLYLTGQDTRLNELVCKSVTLL
ncbi:MAG: ribonuclease III [Eubacterium sp.]|nr:ribonuclease III [Eubacterium sp.]